jgi:hypothetical protein
MTTDTVRSCPICKLQGQPVQVWDVGERLSLECRRCGNFTITATAAAMAEKRESGPKLSAWIRERSESGAYVPEINSNTLKELEAVLPNYRVSEKQLLLLRALERRTKFPGQEVALQFEHDYPLAWAAGEDECRFLVYELAERGLVRSNRLSGGKIDRNYIGNSIVLEITTDGWTFLDEHARPAAISDQVFVAMSFSPELSTSFHNYDAA